MARKAISSVDHHMWSDTRYRMWKENDLFEIGGEMSRYHRTQWHLDLLHPDTRHKVTYFGESALVWHYFITAT